MRQTVRLILILTGASFMVSALVHQGVLVSGYEHSEAATAESVIAAVLLAGFALTWVWPAWVRPIALAALGFALLGTLVGVLTIAIGIGPRTVLDVAYHLAVLVALAWGLVLAGRAPGDSASQHV